MNNAGRIGARHVLVAIWIVLLATGQMLSVALDTDSLWPFTRANVYAAFSPNQRAISYDTQLLTAAGEIHIVSSGLANQRVVRRFTAALLRSKSDDDRQRVASAFFEFILSRRELDPSISGLRTYRRVWNLADGSIAESEVLVEFQVQ